jgi:hypothetical protein
MTQMQRRRITVAAGELLNRYRDALAEMDRALHAADDAATDSRELETVQDDAIGAVCEIRDRLVTMVFELHDFERPAPLAVWPAWEPMGFVVNGMIVVASHSHADEGEVELTVLDPARLMPLD